MSIAAGQNPRISECGQGFQGPSQTVSVSLQGTSGSRLLWSPQPPQVSISCWRPSARAVWGALSIREGRGRRGGDSTAASPTGTRPWRVVGALGPSLSSYSCPGGALEAPPQKEKGVSPRWMASEGAPAAPPHPQLQPNNAGPSGALLVVICLCGGRRSQECRGSE